MIISIHQPDYVPYLGYFYKIFHSDVFVFLDDVQFSNNNMHHWNKVKNPNGEYRLKVPVDYSFGDKINQVRTKDELGWKTKHLSAIKANYSKARFFNEIFPEYRDIILDEYKSLAEMNITINKFVCDGFAISRDFVCSSNLNISSSKENRVIDICLALNGKKYLSGNGARAYQTEEHFNNKGIQLIYTDYSPVEYTQLWNEFIPNLSVLDYLFNCGFVNPFAMNNTVGDNQR